MQNILTKMRGLTLTLLLVTVAQGQGQQNVFRINSSRSPTVSPAQGDKRATTLTESELLLATTTPKSPDEDDEKFVRRPALTVFLDLIQGDVCSGIDNELVVEQDVQFARQVAKALPWLIQKTGNKVNIGKFSSSTILSCSAC